MIPYFRAWDKEVGVMLNVAGIHWGINAIEFGDEGLDSGIYDLDDYDVMEYTTLTDKNDKEICECDLVAKFGSSDPAFRSVVVRHLGSFGYTSMVGGFIPFASNYHFNWVNGKSLKIEVIGNPYENPKLR